MKTLIEKYLFLVNREEDTFQNNTFVYNIYLTEFKKAIVKILQIYFFPLIQYVLEFTIFFFIIDF